MSKQQTGSKREFYTEQEAADWSFMDSRSQAYTGGDEDEFYVRPSYTTFLLVWLSSVLDDVIGFTCHRPHLSALGAIVVLTTTSPFLTMMAAVVCTALLIVLFLTCVEGTMIAVFMFLLGSFVISTAVVSMITTMTLFLIYSMCMRLRDNCSRVKLAVVSVIHAYSNAVLERKRTVARAVVPSYRRSADKKASGGASASYSTGQF